jgi:uncharacterized protein (TIGR02145 family)
MAENLNYGTYVALNTSTGATIDQRVQSSDSVDERWCWKNDVNLCSIWGGLYQWAEAMALPSSCNFAAGCTLSTPHRGICPRGWHIPTQSEWRKLLDFAESFDTTIGAGDVLKAASTEFWQVEGYDTLNFTCLGAGGMYPSTPGGFGDRLRFANIWGAGEGTTPSESDSTVILQSGTCFRTRGCNDATYCSAKGSSSGAVGAACAKRDGSSIRCVVD